MIANCIYDSNVSFSTFLSLFSTRLWKPRQYPSLLPLLMLIPKIRKTLGRLSPCMTNVLRSHRIFLVAVIIVPPVRCYLSVVSSFPSCLIFVDIIVVIIVRCCSRFRSALPLFCYFILRLRCFPQQTNRLVRSQNLHWFLPTTCILDLLVINFS